MFDSGTLQFDVNVGAGTSLPAGEETDLVLHALERGATGRYEPSLTVYHAIERSSTMQMEQRRLRDRAFAYVITKHALRKNVSLAWILARHFGKECVKALVSREARSSVAEQATGMRLAWRGRNA